MRPLLSLLVFTLLAGAALAHPSKVSKVIPPSMLKDGELPPFQSFHLHVMFQTHNNDSATGFDNAMRFREQFMQVFNMTDDPSSLCQDDFVNLGPCMFPVYTHQYGPFPVPQWAVFFHPDLFTPISMWAMQNRGLFDILIHPNSGYEFEDHALWPVWGGNKWFLDFSDPEFKPKLPPLQPCQYNP